MELEVFLPYVVGVIGVPVVTWLKDALGIAGKGAVTLTIVMSFVLGAASLAFLGELQLDGDFFAIATQVFGTATAVYKLWPSN